MNENELADRISALPGRFAGRLNATGLEDVADAARVGEWSEAVDILVAGLCSTNAPVSAAGHTELRQLLEATGMPAEPLARLNVQADPPAPRT